MGKSVPITLRVNPDVDARTHAKISTGKSENKFGIPISKARGVYAEAASLPGIEVVGVDAHIGSQLTELEPFRAAFLKLADLTRTLREDGHDIRRIDLGGGLGIPYVRSNEAPPLPFDYGRVVPTLAEAPFTSVTAATCSRRRCSTTHPTSCPTGRPASATCRALEWPRAICSSTSQEELASLP